MKISASYYRERKTFSGKDNTAPGVILQKLETYQEMGCSSVNGHLGLALICRSEDSSDESSDFVPALNLT